MSETETQAQFARLERLAAGLPGVEAGTCYGQAALKVGGRMIAVAKSADLVALSMPLDQKEHLIELAPEIYFETPHFHGWPAVLVRAAVIGDDELRLRLQEAWKRRATARQRKQYEAAAGSAT
ncbi:MmcQ/YjbR family DNA-binding protein [Mycoplana rhizolycopersici]|uniref:MmcQ/YjbR family DNA-binding protein n=1 Tax=Mycoplana rhizolycopersici TaxID=2746702 RepID=A0ABX2QIL4_9HYPH|nr:MmcQ/YjbR family DNA-binding protein [Rhizobium rhizolycopersici]NVP57540.1 MmcQ/YjbR family DNA-binding protein [Rhizobium rhizolycopersici]